MKNINIQPTAEEIQEVRNDMNALKEKGLIDFTEDADGNLSIDMSPMIEQVRGFLPPGLTDLEVMQSIMESLSEVHTAKGH